VERELTGERALACAGWPGETDAMRPAALRIEGLPGGDALRRFALQQGEQAGQRPPVAAANRCHEVIH
jgi:hypothetical protein